MVTFLKKYSSIISLVSFLTFCVIEYVSNSTFRPLTGYMFMGYHWAIFLAFVFYIISLFSFPWNINIKRHFLLAHSVWLFLCVLFFVIGKISIFFWSAFQILGLIILWLTQVALGVHILRHNSEKWLIGNYGLLHIIGGILNFTWIFALIWFVLFIPLLVIDSIIKLKNNWFFQKIP